MAFLVPMGTETQGIVRRLTKLGHKLGLEVLGSFIKEMAFLVTIGTESRASSKVDEGRRGAGGGVGYT